VLADAGSIPAVSTTEQKIRAPSASLGPFFMFVSAESGALKLITKKGRVRAPAFHWPSKNRSLNLMCAFKVGLKRFLNLGRQVIKVDVLLLNFSTQPLRAAGCTCQASYQILSELL